MKILVMGSSGFLGSTILRKHRENHEIIGTSYSQSGQLKLDVADRERVVSLIREQRPDAVINSAAMRNDLVEKDHPKGFSVNVEGARNVALACKEADAFIVHISTDLIFDGNKGSYVEEDLANPVSYYGITKSLSEAAVRDTLMDGCVARTSLLYGLDRLRPNFATLVINSLREGKTFEALRDQYVTPSYVENVADMLIEICERKLSGTFHTAGASRITRYDFARQIAQVFSLNADLIRPISMDQMKWSTKRGKDCSLNVNLSTKILNAKPMSSLEGLQAMRSHE
jgi:dTDP-4-dehydrorhamnose reductase